MAKLRRSFLAPAMIALSFTAGYGASAQPDEVKTVAGFAIVDGVNARNGNFSLTYPAFDGDGGIPYRRTYNSFADNRGTFGLGWGSTFDTRLVPLPDGRIAVRENGNGLITVYGAPVAGETAAAFETLLIAQEKKATRSDNILLRLKAPETPIPLDRSKALAEQACNDPAVIRVPFGWDRRTCGDGVQHFNVDGRLTGYEAEGVTVTIRRAREEIVDIQSSLGGKLFFKKEKFGLRVTDAKAGWYSYGFDKDGRNTIADSPASGRITFTYDAASRLEDVALIDDTHTRIVYDDKGRVAKKIARTGDETVFDYRQEPGTEATTLVTWKPHGGAPDRSVLYRFVAADGE